MIGSYFQSSLIKFIFFLNILQLISLRNGLAFGKIIGSIPQNIATVPSLIYLSWNIISHPGVPEKSLVIHKIIIQIKTIPTDNSLHLEYEFILNRIFFAVLSTLVSQDHYIVSLACFLIQFVLQLDQDPNEFERI
jgi:hypothetical protein